MRFEDALQAVETADTVDDLLNVLQSVALAYGFISCGFVDASCHAGQAPFFIGTHDKNFVTAYIEESLSDHDPILALTRRTNMPLNWSQLPLTFQKKSAGYKTMTKAWDFGILDGITIPFHYNDQIGRRYSANCTFFWKDKVTALRQLFTVKRHELHMIVLYWAQKTIDLEAINQKLKPIFAVDKNNSDKAHALTERERDVIAWAGRGKTVQDTADILRISYDTVETHMRHAMRKLNAHTKTQAVVKAIYLGLVDI